MSCEYNTSFEKKKIKRAYGEYLHALNITCDITCGAYRRLLDYGMKLLDKMYDQGIKDGSAVNKSNSDTNIRPNVLAKTYAIHCSNGEEAWKTSAFFEEYTGIKRSIKSPDVNVPDKGLYILTSDGRAIEKLTPTFKDIPVIESEDVDWKYYDGWEREGNAKPKFNLEAYKGKYVMYCCSPKRARIFCDFLHANGRKWVNGQSYAERYDWWNSEACYYEFNEGYFGTSHAYKDYKVLDFDNFDWSDFDDSSKMQEEE